MGKLPASFVAGNFQTLISIRADSGLLLYITKIYTLQSTSCCHMPYPIIQQLASELV